MKKIKISEIFYSLQGEGLHTGSPSIFLRTFGCNFRCKGFGLPLGETTTEVNDVIKNIDQYPTYESLPLVKTGCDSYAAVYPEFKHLSPMLTVDEIIDKILSLLPNKDWHDEHLVITGGEPLLSWQGAFVELITNEKMKNLKHVTFETNGTQHLTNDLKELIQQSKFDRSSNLEFTFSVSPKLACSGESFEKAIKPEVVSTYSDIATTYLKFVVSNEYDVQEVMNIRKKYIDDGFRGSVYIMPIGGTTDTFSLNNKNVAELAMKYGLKYSDRLQVALWKNAWGT